MTDLVTPRVGRNQNAANALSSRRFSSHSSPSHRILEFMFVSQQLWCRAASTVVTLCEYDAKTGATVHVRIETREVNNKPRFSVPAALLARISNSRVFDNNAIHHRPLPRHTAGRATVTISGFAFVHVVLARQLCEPCPLFARPLQILRQNNNSFKTLSFLLFSKAKELFPAQLIWVVTKPLFGAECGVVQSPTRRFWRQVI
jgi:hypothetical protein